MSKSDNLKRLSERVRRTKVDVVRQADIALDAASEAKDTIEELEGELENSWQDCAIKDEKIESLEYDYAELEKKLDSHWCLCPHCGREHASSK